MSGRRTCLLASSIGRRGISSTSSNLVATSQSKPAWLSFSKEQEKTSGHSTLLSKDQHVYELVTDVVIPSQWEAYKANKRLQVELTRDSPGIKGELVGSWRSVTGDTAFKATHLYKYQDGWNDIDSDRQAKKALEEYKALYSEGLSTINQQSSELAKAFMFWPSPDVREGPNVYDIRTYSLKPGSLYDWSNYWSKGIQFRSSVRQDVPYCGLFTQLGQLHTIYHIWCYKSMADRKQCREATWHYPEWNDIVANTVPLVNTMSTTLLEPLEFSPTQ